MAAAINSVSHPVTQTQFELFYSKSEPVDILVSYRGASLCRYCAAKLEGMHERDTGALTDLTKEY
jgi:hypothetical protein